MKFYLCGPMSGYPDLNYPAFIRAARELRAVGHEVVSPAEMHPADPALTHRYCLRKDIDAILDPERVEALCVLPGWSSSRGCKVELTVASVCGIPAFCYPRMIPLNVETRLERLPFTQAELRAVAAVTPPGRPIQR